MPTESGRALTPGKAEPGVWGKPSPPCPPRGTYKAGGWAHSETGGAGGAGRSCALLGAEPALDVLVASPRLSDHTPLPRGAVLGGGAWPQAPGGGGSEQACSPGEHGSLSGSPSALSPTVQLVRSAHPARHANAVPLEGFTTVFPVPPPPPPATGSALVTCKQLGNPTAIGGPENLVILLQLLWGTAVTTGLRCWTGAPPHFPNSGLEGGMEGPPPGRVPGPGYPQPGFRHAHYLQGAPARSTSHPVSPVHPRGVRKSRPKRQPQDVVAGVGGDWVAVRLEGVNV